jgi:hypothetical protein
MISPRLCVDSIGIGLPLASLTGVTLNVTFAPSPFAAESCTLNVKARSNRLPFSGVYTKRPTAALTTWPAVTANISCLHCACWQVVDALGQAPLHRRP